MKKIKLTNSNDVVLVDDEDFEYLNKQKWVKHTNGYAQSNKVYKVEV